MGYIDSNGVYIYDENDLFAPVHTSMNLLGGSVSEALEEMSLEKVGPKKFRNCAISMAGVVLLAGQSANITPVQTTPAAPFGPGRPYIVTMKTMLTINYDPKAEANVALYKDGGLVMQAPDRNPATTGTWRDTAALDFSVLVDDDLVHTWQGRVFAVAGSNAISFVSGGSPYHYFQLELEEAESI